MSRLQHSSTTFRYGNLRAEGSAVCPLRGCPCGARVRLPSHSGVVGGGRPVHDHDDPPNSPTMHLSESNSACSRRTRTLGTATSALKIVAEQRYSYPRSDVHLRRLPAKLDPHTAGRLASGPKALVGRRNGIAGLTGPLASFLYIPRTCRPRLGGAQRPAPPPGP